MSLLRITTALWIALPASAASATDRHVPADYPTIQSALDAAVDGDSVVVARGRYYEALRFPPRDIHLFAPEGPTLTTIDGQALDTVITFDGAPGRGAIVEGFTLTNGIDPDGNKAGGVHIGQGGSPIVRGNVIRQNWGGRGHGVSLIVPASPLIEGNEIRHNRTGPASSSSGGGIGLYASACPSSQPCVVEIRNNYIANNVGGGIQLNGGRAHVIGNVIEYNQAGRGGGISSVNGSASRIENNLLHANRANSSGGGIYSSVSMGSTGLVVVNNTLVANEAETASAIHSSGYDATSRVINNLVSATGASPAFFCDIGSDGAGPVTRHNIVHAPEGTAYGGACAGADGMAGNQTAAPVFMGKDNFRLQPHSPGINQGDNVESSQATDLDGHARIADGHGDGVHTIDVGAYELQHPLIFSNGFEPLP
ncbi:right-handed parallel beta-helix repeat-containing protein [Dokdonella sp. MW10]|uniref:right-handed parallel beta-helix repeat-containing protein n=1 Tax=Dokdonella sp. MW10 TaxID=2992926 RepID=UPI003F8215B4